MGADLHAQAAQRSPLHGAESARLGADAGAVQHAAGLHQLIGKAPRQTLDPAVGDRRFQAAQGRQAARGFGGEEGLKPLGRPLPRRVGTQVTQQTHPGRQRRPASRDHAGRLAAPE